MPSGLSSRFPTTNHQAHNQRTLCHPDRSVAQWRDLQFPFPHHKSAGPQPTHPLSSRLERTRISCCAAVDRAACAAFRKESRMNLAEPTQLYRKSGVAQRRDLRFRSLRLVRATSSSSAWQSPRELPYYLPSDPLSSKPRQSSRSVR
jgi:hypothetical protein